jgi:hypothetical protein
MRLGLYVELAAHPRRGSRQLIARRRRRLARGFDELHHRRAVLLLAVEHFARDRKVNLAGHRSLLKSDDAVHEWVHVLVIGAVDQ